MLEEGALPTVLSEPVCSYTKFWEHYLPSTNMTWKKITYEVCALFQAIHFPAHTAVYHNINEIYLILMLNHNHIMQIAVNPLYCYSLA